MRSGGIGSALGGNTDWEPDGSDSVSDLGGVGGLILTLSAVEGKVAVEDIAEHVGSPKPLIRLNRLFQLCFFFQKNFPLPLERRW